MSEKAPRFKSPPYPYLDLEAALERARQLATVARGFAVPVPAVAKTWKFSEKSSSTVKVLGALNQFGLIQDEGPAGAKAYKLSDLAEAIISDHRPQSKDRDEAIKAAALRPKVFQELWEKFGKAEVDQTTLEYELTRNRKLAGKAPFSEDAAKDVALTYRASLLFAGLDQSNYTGKDGVEDLTADESKTQNGKIDVSSKVRWNSGGVDQFENPATVLAISDDGKWAWTDQGDAAVNVAELTAIAESSEQESDVPPPMPLHLVENMKQRRQIPPKENLFEEKKALDEGEAVLVWPRNLSQDSVEDMEYWLNGVLRQIKRRAAKTKG